MRGICDPVFAQGHHNGTAGLLAILPLTACWSVVRMLRRNHEITGVKPRNSA